MFRLSVSRGPLFLFLVAIAACAPELKPRPYATSLPPSSTKTRAASPAASTPAASTGAPSVSSGSPATLIVRVKAGSNLDPLAALFESNPSLRLTLVFPANYFQDPRAAASVQKWAALQSAGRVEMALTLDNEPILPLLANIKKIPEAQRMRVAFAWPDDIAHEMAGGSAAYQRRWQQLPSGFYSALSSGQLRRDGRGAKISPELGDGAEPSDERRAFLWNDGPDRPVAGAVLECRRARRLGRISTVCVRRFFFHHRRQRCASAFLRAVGRLGRETSGTFLAHGDGVCVELKRRMGASRQCGPVRGRLFRLARHLAATSRVERLVRRARRH